MDFIKNLLRLSCCLFILAGCGDNEKTERANGSVTSKPSVSKLKDSLTRLGYQTFDYVEEGTNDTILMQQYFLVLLKRGPNRSENKQEADSLQSLHLQHMSRMYEEGYADLMGPFGDDGEIRGIIIYNTPNLQIADSLANLDPLIRSGSLVAEIHPWWAGKGYGLR
ncbi:YciI family protein [Zeaxanthinibacter enoshimensis]|uniref:YciI family protein n=1 Tax=Zeaxanthinibacter enoshimensis TaxID=392009 RepID=UPI00356679D9